MPLPIAVTTDSLTSVILRLRHWKVFSSQLVWLAGYFLFYAKCLVRSLRYRSFRICSGTGWSPRVVSCSRLASSVWDFPANCYAKGFLALSSLDKGQPQNRPLKLVVLGGRPIRKHQQAIWWGMATVVLQVRRPTWSYRDTAKGPRIDNGCFRVLKCSCWVSTR